MARERFALDSLLTLDDGRIREAVNMEIRKLVADIYDRGADGVKRTLEVVVDFTPQVVGGNVEDVDVEVAIKTKAPARRSKTYRMQQSGGNSLVFNPESRDQPRQRTLDEDGNQD